MMSDVDKFLKKYARGRGAGGRGCSCIGAQDLLETKNIEL